LFGVSDDKPVAIIAIDDEARLRAAIDTIMLQAPRSGEHD
jgi:hypothetical protein